MKGSGSKKVIKFPVKLVIQFKPFLLIVNIEICLK